MQGRFPDRIASPSATTSSPCGGPGRSISSPPRCWLAPAPLVVLAIARPVVGALLAAACAVRMVAIVSRSCLACLLLLLPPSAAEGGALPGEMGLFPGAPVAPLPRVAAAAIAAVVASVAAIAFRRTITAAAPLVTAPDASITSCSARHAKDCERVSGLAPGQVVRAALRLLCSSSARHKVALLRRCCQTAPARTSRCQARIMRTCQLLRACHAACRLLWAWAIFCAATACAGGGAPIASRIALAAAAAASGSSG